MILIKCNDTVSFKITAHIRFNEIATDADDKVLSKCEVCVKESRYCESTYLQYPNLKAALLGLDLPSLNPNPKDHINEPGIRLQIFQPTSRSKDGDMVQYDYLETRRCLKCEANYDEYVFSSFEETIDNWSKFVSSGYDLILDIQTKIKSPVSLTIPPLFSRSWSTTDKTDGMKSHFDSDGGSVAHTRAECAIYCVTVNK